MMKVKQGGAADEAQQELFGVSHYVVSDIAGYFYGVSVLTGIAWLCVAIVHLIVAFVSKDKKE